MAGLPVLIILDGQKVIVSGLVIEPVIGRDHEVGIERGHHVLHDVLRSEAQFRGVHAVNIQADRGIIHVLRDIGFANSRDAANRPAN